MNETKLDDLTVVGPLWAILRALRAPLIVVAVACLFCDRYGCPTAGVTFVNARGDYVRHDNGPMLRFRKLDQPAALAALGWVTGLADAGEGE